MTVCNMSIEAGARAGMIAPDDTTFAYLEGRPRRAERRGLERRVEDWRELPTRRGRRASTATVDIDAAALAPQVTWGTNPGHGRPGHRARADARGLRRPGRPRRRPAGARVHGPERGHGDRGHRARRGLHRLLHQRRASSDLRAAASVVRGKRVATGVRAMVVPGSTQVKAQAEAEGLDQVFRAAGFEWRDAGCSMCLGDERRHPRSPASAAPRPATATSRDARARAGAPIWSARRWPRPRPSPGTWWTSATSTPIWRGWADEGLHARRGRRLPARPVQRRHRPDHPEAVPEAHRAHRLRRVPLLGLEGRRRTSPSTAPSTRARRSWSPAGTSAAAPRASTRPGRSRTTASAP